MAENYYLYPVKKHVRERVLHYSPVNAPRINKLRNQKAIPDLELEKFPFERVFNAFVKEAKSLQADHDTVSGIKRQYVNTAQLYPVYQKAFEELALGAAAVNYRLSKMNMQDFPDDFISLQDAVANWQPKYFVNRLNKELLKKIYLPYPGGDILELVQTVALYEDAIPISRIEPEFKDTDELDEF